MGETAGLVQIFSEKKMRAGCSCGPSCGLHLESMAWKAAEPFAV